MKSINKIAVAALLALSSAGLASAQTVVHVSGSSAFRNAVVAAEVNIAGGTVKAISFKNNATNSSTSVKSLTAANYSIVYGTTYIFENYWSGSIAGDENLVDGQANSKLNFPLSTTYSASAVTATAATPPTTQASISSSGEFDYYSSYDSSFPDIVFSDVSFSTAQQVILASGDHTTATPQNGVQVGIVPFVFIASGSSDIYSELTSSLSVTPQNFTDYWSSTSPATLSIMTGNNADEAISVYPVGRDVDSGTRATALAETGYGLKGSGKITALVYQYYPWDTSAHATADYTAAGTTPPYSGQTGAAQTGIIGDDSTLTNPTIGYINLTTPETYDQYNMPLGDGGYNSGGNLGTALSTAFSGLTDTVLLAYIGIADYQSTVAALPATNRISPVVLSYCGSYFDPTVAGATNATNLSKIYEGQYTFWTYENEYYNTAAGTPAVALKNALNGGLDTLASNGVTFNSMNVSRSGDGQNVQ